MIIGVFDSGIGGEAVAKSLQEAFPEATIHTVNDREHLPYGDRTHDDVIALTDAAIQPLLALSPDIIVVACNTATALAIETLRERYPEQKFIGLEPMVKPAAALTRTGVITICATPATLGSTRYQNLKKDYAKDIVILEPDCSLWAKMIEDNDVNEQHITAVIHDAKTKNSDVLVLACTHYHWIRELIEQHATGMQVLDPSEAIVRRVKQLLETS